MNSFWSVFPVLHLRKIAAFIVFEHAFEDIDIEKSFNFELFLILWIWCVNDGMAKIGKRYLLGGARACRQPIVPRCRG